MEKLLTIRDFSKLTGLESSTLRYWDDIGLFYPAKRDTDTNYRYYAPNQMIAVKFINVLSELNTPLKTIAEIESKKNPENLMNLIYQQEKLLDKQMLRLREQYAILHTRRELINLGMNVDERQLAVCRLEQRAFIPGPRNEWRQGEEFYRPFARFCKKAEDLRINLHFPVGAAHDSFEAFEREPGQPDYFFSLDPAGNRFQEAGEYLVGYTRGYYGQFGDFPQRMKAHIEEHALSVTGPVYAVYLHDELCMKDPSQYLAQVSVAVSGKHRH